MNTRTSAKSSNSVKCNITGEFINYLRQYWKWSETSLEDLASSEHIMAEFTDHNTVLLTTMGGDWIGAVGDLDLEMVKRMVAND